MKYVSVSYEKGELHTKIKLEKMTANADALELRFRTGGMYTLDELAELARRGLEGTTQTQAADYLNEHHPSDRGRYRKQQISNALNNPSGNPGMILLLVKAFTPYKADEAPRYRLSKHGS